MFMMRGKDPYLSFCENNWYKCCKYAFRIVCCLSSLNFFLIISAKNSRFSDDLILIKSLLVSLTTTKAHI